MPAVNHVESFRTAMLAAGLTPPDFIEPGRWHRFPGIGKANGNKDASCKLSIDGQVGWFRDWSTDLDEEWWANPDTLKTPAQRAQLAQIKEQAETEERERYARAAKEAAALWEQARPAGDHAYLAGKHIPALGIRQRGDVLIVPARIGEELLSLQFIAPNGDKQFLSGGRVKGCYHAIGNAMRTDALAICEGYATGASIHEAIGLPVAVAFFAGNLLEVAKAMRAKFPDVPLILAADDDWKKEKNIGVAKAIEAARAVDGLVAVPDFGDERPDDAKDFNDLANLRGADAVRRAIENAKKPDIGEDQSVPESAASANPAPSTSRMTERPDAAERPRATSPADSGLPRADQQPGKANAPAALRVIELREFLALTLPPRVCILSPWLLTQSLNMIHSWRGIGKTHLQLNIAYAIATGRTFLSWTADKPRRVLVIDGEMPASVLQERLEAIVAANGVEPADRYLSIITPDLQSGAMPDLATFEGQDAINEIINRGDAEVIIVDNLSCLVRGSGRENDAESWLPVAKWALLQRQRGRSVIFVHHSGKNLTQRGTSKREDLLDTVIALTRPPGYDPKSGACFEIHFEKARGLIGEPAAPIEATLSTDATGQATWTWRPVSDSTLERVAALAHEGLSKSQIAVELGVHRSTVSRAWNKAAAEGLVRGNKGASADQYRRASDGE